MPSTATVVLASSLQTSVIRLYVALFGRAPEAEGIAYWVAQLSSGITIEKVAQDMFNVEPSRAYYPASLSNEGIVTQFYTNVLGRVPDQEGLAYWTQRLDSFVKEGPTHDRALAQGKLILEIIQAVVNYSGSDSAGLLSQSLFKNKVAVAQEFALGVQGIDISHATELIRKVQSGNQGTSGALDYLSKLYSATPKFEQASLTIDGKEDTVIQGVFQASDTDRGDLLKYTMASNPKHGHLELSADGSYVYTPNRDYNGPESFVITVTDLANNHSSQNINLALQAVNDAPIAKPEKIVLMYPGSFTLPTASNDSDDNGKFVIDSYTSSNAGSVKLVDGKLMYQTPTTITNSTETITYVLKDADGVKSLPTTVTIITAPDITLPPQVASEFQRLVVDENRNPGTSVGHIDARIPTQYSANFGAYMEILSGNEKGIFAINSFTGEIVVGKDGGLNAEEQNKFTLTISAKFTSNTDPNADWYTVLNVLIEVNNINEFRPQILSQNSYSIQENSLNVASLAVIDDDRFSSVHSYRLGGADAGKFTINQKGELSFLSAPDYERPQSSKGTNSYEIYVIANDGQFDSEPKNIQIIVSDILGSPPVDATTIAPTSNSQTELIELIGSAQLNNYLCL